MSLSTFILICPTSNLVLSPVDLVFSNFSPLSLSSFTTTLPTINQIIIFLDFSKAFDSIPHFELNNNEKTSQNPRRVAHCRVSSLVMVCRRSLANLLATETALLTRRQQSADHKDKVCQVGVTVNTE